jgi:putative addiction module CopG family antidote
MDVLLSPELEKFVNSQVRAGKYRSPAEVVHDALERLKRAKEGPDRTPGPQSREELEIELLKSIERLDRGEGISIDEAQRRVQERIAQHQKK